MSRLGSRGHSDAMADQLPPDFEIFFDGHVFDYVLHELRRYPKSEEGGKYIGYIERSHTHKHRVVITDFLPGGPNATRTSVEFLPDGEFQETLFRQAEARDRAIEHIGSWHSHHCNSLDRLSGGDIEGYFKTVNKAAYRPDVFVASLVKYLPHRKNDKGWIDHFLFIRDHDRYYKITNHVGTAHSPSKFGDITGHSLDLEHVATETASWYETDIGRSTLAEDKRFLSERFGSNLRATRRDGVITITCRAEPKFIAVSYPVRADDRELKISVGSGSRTLLTIACDSPDRRAAYIAAFCALDSL